MRLETERLCSRAMPDCLKPPKGAASGSCGPPLMTTRPDQLLGDLARVRGIGARYTVVVSACAGVVRAIAIANDATYGLQAFGAELTRSTLTSETVNHGATYALQPKTAFSRIQMGF
jgi:hypothetical protein